MLGVSMMFVFEVMVGDFVWLMEIFIKEMLEYWILRGECSVWLVVVVFKICCVVEEELDRVY